MMTLGVEPRSEAASLFTPAVAEMFTRVLDMQAEVESRAAGSEESLAMATSLAVRRAELLGRPVFPLDVEFMLSMWRHWPFKPPPPGDYREFVAYSIEPLIANLDAYGLASAIHSAALVMPFEALYVAQQQVELPLLFTAA
jgi:hypothetical protein